MKKKKMRMMMKTLLLRLINFVDVENPLARFVLKRGSSSPFVCLSSCWCLCRSCVFCCCCFSLINEEL